MKDLKLCAKDDAGNEHCVAVGHSALGEAKHALQEKIEATNKVTLELTQNEASVLRRLLWSHVIGSTDGPRGALDRIGYKLEAIGVNPSAQFNTSADHDVVFIHRD